MQMCTTKLYRLKEPLYNLNLALVLVNAVDNTLTMDPNAFEGYFS